MHRVFQLVFLLCISSFSYSALAENASLLVRIRTHIDLPSFPKLQNAHIKQISHRLWNLDGNSLVLSGKKLSAQNLVHRKPNGLYDVISLVEFNDYLAGVVTGEMPSSWPLEALKAQAVVARSYALSRISERRYEIYHLEADHLDQVYRAQASEKARAAVLLTEGIVLKKPSGEILKAYYHADCGGRTVTASSVWGAGEFNSGTAQDPWCSQRKSNRWSHEVSRREFTEKLQLQNPQLPTSSQFAAQAQVVRIGDLFFSTQKLRELFGFFNLRSSVRQLETQGNLIKLSGQGFGHGAGLCQWGTRDQVKAGRTYLQVLKHYYPLAKIEKNQTHLSTKRLVSAVSN